MEAQIQTKKTFMNQKLRQIPIPRTKSHTADAL